jgi:hypothetical protein
VVFFLNALVFSLIVGGLIFVLVEVPWMKTEKWVFSILLGGEEKHKKV